MTACSSSPAAAGPFFHHNAAGWMVGWKGGQSPPSLSYSSRDVGWEEETEERPLPSLGHGLAHSSAGIGPPPPSRTLFHHVPVSLRLSVCPAAGRQATSHTTRSNKHPIIFAFIHCLLSPLTHTHPSPSASSWLVPAPWGQIASPRGGGGRWAGRRPTGAFIFVVVVRCCFVVVFVHPWLSLSFRRIAFALLSSSSPSPSSLSRTTASNCLLFNGGQTPSRTQNRSSGPTPSQGVISISMIIK